MKSSFMSGLLLSGWFMVLSSPDGSSDPDATQLRARPDRSQSPSIGGERRAVARHHGPPWRCAAVAPETGLLSFETWWARSNPRHAPFCIETESWAWAIGIAEPIAGEPDEFHAFDCRAQRSAARA